MCDSADSYVTQENQAAEDNRLDFNRGMDAYGYGDRFQADWPKWYREGWQAAFAADKQRCKELNDAEEAAAAAKADMAADGLEWIGDDDASTDWDEYASWYDDIQEWPEDYRF